MFRNDHKAEDVATRIDHLMEAVVQLRRLFAFARAAIIVQTLLATAIAGGFVWCTVLADKGTRCFGLFGF